MAETPFWTPFGAFQLPESKFRAPFFSFFWAPFWVVIAAHAGDPDLVAFGSRLERCNYRSRNLGVRFGGAFWVRFGCIVGSLNAIACLILFRLFAFYWFCLHSEPKPMEQTTLFVSETKTMNQSVQPNNTFVSLVLVQNCEISWFLNQNQSAWPNLNASYSKLW